MSLYVKYAYESGHTETVCIDGLTKSHNMKRENQRPVSAFFYSFGSVATKAHTDKLILYISKYASKLLHPVKRKICIDRSVWELHNSLAYQAGYCRGRSFGKV